MTTWDNVAERQPAIVPLSLLYQGCRAVCLPISNVSPLFLHSRNIWQHTCLEKHINSSYNSFQQQWTCAYKTIEFRRNMKWNESGFRPPLCTYSLNWARRTSWGWWDDWDDTVLQTQFEPWRSEAEHATSWAQRLPTILTFTHRRNINVRNINSNLYKRSSI